jgi:hypothetical protein
MVFSIFLVVLFNFLMKKNNCVKFMPWLSFVCCMRSEHCFMSQGFHFCSNNSMNKLTKLLHFGLWVLTSLFFHTLFNQITGHYAFYTF